MYWFLLFVILVAAVIYFLSKNGDRSGAGEDDYDDYDDYRGEDDYYY